MKRWALICILGWALTGCPGKTTPPFDQYSGSTFSVGYPKGWTVQVLDPNAVMFDGRTGGTSNYGTTLKVETVTTMPKLISEHGCGSHICVGTLSVQRAPYVLTLIHGYDPDDSHSSEGEARRGLELLGKQVLATLKPNSP